MVKKCMSCGYQYSLGLPSCPKCGSRESIGDASSLEDVDALFGGHDAQQESAQHSHKGGEFFMKGDFKNAKIEFEAAVNADPNSANDYENLGATLCKLGLYSEAIPHLEKALRIQPAKTTAKQFLAEARAKVSTGSSGQASTRNMSSTLYNNKLYGIAIAVVLTLALFVWPTPYHYRHKIVGTFSSGKYILPYSDSDGDCLQRNGCVPIYAKVRSIWIFGEKQYLTWLSLEDKKLGQSPWFSGDQIFSTQAGFGGWRIVSGMALTEESISIAANAQSRLLRTYWHDNVFARVQTASFGVIQAKVMEQDWSFIEPEEPLTLAESGEALSVKERVANLRINLEFTNTSDASQDVYSDLYLVSEHNNVILAALQNTTLQTGSSSFVKLNRGETGFVKLVASLSDLEVVRKYQPFHLMHGQYGWLMPVSRLPQ